MNILFAQFAQVTFGNMVLLRDPPALPRAFVESLKAALPALHESLC